MTGCSSLYKGCAELRTEYNVKNLQSVRSSHILVCQQADIGSGTAQHATSNLPASAFRDNDQMRPEAATSNPACCPEAADDNAGPAPVSDTVGTQAAKQLLGPAVIHAKSLQQLADPSPTSQPLVVNDRSIQLAGGILASAHPPAVRSARSPTADEIHDYCAQLQVAVWCKTAVSLRFFRFFNARPERFLS